MICPLMEHVNSRPTLILGVHTNARGTPPSLTDDGVPRWSSHPPGLRLHPFMAAGFPPPVLGRAKVATRGLYDNYTTPVCKCASGRECGYENTKKFLLSYPPSTTLMRLLFYRINGCASISVRQDILFKRLDACECSRVFARIGQRHTGNKRVHSLDKLAKFL